ncbi:hypothetical protein F5883DRAFT_536715 [Diaporthe sp. PMI_573]|nr:hypothetical protein F5883DRAFT_536715 [Diaporthaceae sp. PMI_573]
MLDYAGKHAGKCYDWASSIVKAIGDAGSGGMGGNSVDEDFRLYQHIFVRTVREMMLDQDHVEKRLRAASAGSSHPAGEIHRLIDQCEWQDLAASVVNDRRLAVTLFGAKQVNRDFWSAQFGRTVLQQIDGVRDRYFTELSTPTKYTLSKRARDLSAKKVAHVSHLSSVTPPSPASSRHADGSAAVAAAKSVCSKVASGLGLGRTGSSLRSIFRRSISTSSPGSGPDSTTQLIEEKEKAG